MTLPKTAEEFVAMPEEERAKVLPVWINALTIEKIGSNIRMHVEAGQPRRVMDDILQLVQVTAMLAVIHDKLLAKERLKEAAEEMKPATTTPDGELPN